MVPVAYAFGGFYLFIVAFHVFNELPRYQNNNLGAGDILQYYFCLTPELLGDVLPVALLLGMLYALAQHSRNNEMVAIRSAGVNVWRLAAPYLFVGTLASVTLFASNEWLMPRAQIKAARILESRHTDPEKKTDAQWTPGRISFRNERDHRSWNIGSFNRDTYSMVQVDVGWTDDFGNTQRMFAKSGRREGDVWIFENVELHQPDPQNPFLPLKTITNSLAMPGFNETPELIASEIKIGSMDRSRLAKRVRFSLREIANYLELHPRLEGTKAAELQTQWHGRLALPWKCLVVVFLALPFGLLPGRHNVMVAVGSAIGLVFLFFFLSRFALALGTGGHIPGWLAGWSPILLFGGGGTWMIHRTA